MTMFDVFKSKNIDELVDWLDEYAFFESSPWIKWWDKTFCANCDGVEHEGHDCAWCELTGKCKYFQDMEDIPDNKQIIKMWLGLEVENENQFADNIDNLFDSYFGL